MAAWEWIGGNHDAIQTVLLVFGTIAAFLVIGHNALVSRREATIQMVNEQFGDEAGHYEEFKTLFVDLEASGQALTDYIAETQDNKAGRDILLHQLNRYELIALAIDQGVFSGKFYHRWFYSQLTRDYGRLRSLIEGMRRHFDNDAIFCEFENLANRWKRKRHPVKYPPTLKILWWVLVGRRAKASRALRTKLPAASNPPNPETEAKP
jgi:hypothetical protein